MDNNISHILFCLLRSALWGEAFNDKVSLDVLNQLMIIAEEQTVSGLVYDILSRLGVEMDRKLHLKYVGRNVAIEKKNRAMNAELANFFTILQSYNVDCIVVKGQTIGCLYRKPLQRKPGDIDFLIQQDYQIVKPIISKALNVKLPPKMDDNEVAFTRNRILYELHTGLRGYAKKKHQVVWDGFIEREWKEKYYVDVDGVKVRTLSPTMNAVYIFIHLFFHFVREGVSLRQFCDWAMVLHHYHGEIDKNGLLELLRSLDMLDAFCAFGSILTDYLGLPAKEFPLPLDDHDRRWKDIIVKDIFASGNFGKRYHHSRNTCIFKMETLRIAFRNTFRYYHLCPSEVGGMIPRLVKGNMKILFS